MAERDGLANQASLTSFGPFTFVATTDERIAAMARAEREAGSVRVIFVVMGVLDVAFGALNVFGGLGGIARLHRASQWYVPYGAIWMSLGLVIIVSFVNAERLRRYVVRPTRPLTISITTDGLMMSSRRHVATWSTVRRVTDLGDVFAIDIGLRRTIVPKRIFEDRGERFWELATDRLVGRRMLARGARPSTTIVNTMRG